MAIATTTAIILGTIAAAGIGVSIAGQRQAGTTAKTQEDIAAQQIARKKKRGILKRRTATVLTSPQGALTPAETFGKTLLGS